jgi:hypothetical protein
MLRLVPLVNTLLPIFQAGQNDFRGETRARPASKPWLAEGCSRSTWYRRRAKARQQDALAANVSRASAFVAQLQAELAEATRCHAMTAAIIGEGP